MVTLDGPCFVYDSMFVYLYVCEAYNFTIRSENSQLAGHE